MKDEICLSGQNRNVASASKYFSETKDGSFKSTWTFGSENEACSFEVNQSGFSVVQLKPAFWVE